MIGKKQKRIKPSASRDASRTRGAKVGPGTGEAAPEVPGNSADTGGPVSEAASKPRNPAVQQCLVCGSVSIERMTTRADDYEAVANALNHAGGIVRALWISFVSVGTYLVIVVWSVTHKQLFLETPIKLPLIDVSIPLFGFFLVAPLFFLALHVYLLLQLAAMANRVERHEELISSLPDLVLQSKLRRQLSTFVLIQFLLAQREERKALLPRMLAGVVWLTIVIGPLFFFLLTQWRFLPYQDQFVTWMHRLVIAAGLVVLWVLWPTIVRANSQIIWPTRRQLYLAGPPTAAVGILMLFVLTFPGEPIEQFPGVKQFHRWATWEADESGSESRGNKPPIAASIEGNTVRRRWLQRTPEARRWVTGTLRLVELDVVDDELLQKIEARATALQPWQGERTFRLNGDRSLHYADLISADLRRSDLRRAHFDGANLTYAALDGALLNESSFADAEMTRIDLRGASLAHVSFPGANLIGANLNSALVNGAAGQGANLMLARLQGARLEQAQLSGAHFGWADLRGAVLIEARIQGASFFGARLQGATLSLAQLQGANLENANLEGASLEGAQLHGASLIRTRLGGALINQTFLYRTMVEGIEIDMAIILEPNTQAVRPVGEPDEFTFQFTPAGLFSRIGQTTAALTDIDVDDWIRQAVDYVKIDEHKSLKRQRLGRLKKGGAMTEEDLKVASFWKSAEARSAKDRGQTPEKYVALLSDLACSAEAAPHVARGLLRNNILANTSHISTIAERMMARSEPTTSAASVACPGVIGFNNDDWEALSAQIFLITRASPSPLTLDNSGRPKP